MIAIQAEPCTGCARCAHVCPYGVIEMRNHKAYIADEERCIECGACQMNCDDDAVIVSKGTGCLLVIIKEDILGYTKDDGDMVAVA